MDYHRAPADFGAVGALVRIATCISGRVEVMTHCAPQFNYGAAGGTWNYHGDEYTAMTIAPNEGNIRLDLAGSIQLGVLGARSYGRTTLGQGQSAFMVLSWGNAKAPASLEEAFEALDTTVNFWRDWLSVANIPDHPWKPFLDRSALTLKALSYAPTGAIMAAGTTSLPETPGGERNWDYRYTWIRDSAFMLRALYRLGFNWEAFEYFGFIIDAVSGGDLNRNLELQIMYGIGGERDLTERTLDHLSGYRGARPWRAGAEKIKAEVLDKGVSSRGVFRQHYQTDDLDASLLLLAIMGFLPPDDERIKATVRAIADELTADGLVLRYRVEGTDTGFAGEEGTFTICSFWLVTALAMIGETGPAHALCQKLLSFAGPLQLYAEEIDTTTGEHLGNFPQAFTHLALIEAVSTLIEMEPGQRFASPA
jgi:GH15 family glucan-1,4-alpha-glucosidase